MPWQFVGGTLGARLGGLPRWEAIGTGIGLNARGAMELVIAAIGISIGVATAEGYALLVLIAVTTTLMTSPLLRLVVERIRRQEDVEPGSTAADLKAASW